MAQLYDCRLGVNGVQQVSPVSGLVQSKAVNVAISLDNNKTSVNIMKLRTLETIQLFHIHLDRTLWLHYIVGNTNL